VTRFLAVGVGMVWVVDPEDRTVSVFVPEQLPRVADEHEELTGNSVLPDFRCRVSEFFFVPGHG
jgi:Uma2 family endonuclease